LIDEKFIVRVSETKADYYKILNELKEDIQNLEI
jgi:hypothetical protein